MGRVAWNPPHTPYHNATATDSGRLDARVPPSPAESTAWRSRSRPGNPPFRGPARPFPPCPGR